MRIKIKKYGNWRRVADAARMTVGKAPLTKEPSEEFKDKILMAEHSPIRMIEFDIYLYDIPYFVAMHLVRHHIGCEKFVITNREDRRPVKTEEVNRLTQVDMMISCNAQALINISRKRLCCQASLETRKVWNAIKKAIAKKEPLIAKRMCRECVYRGFCPEMNPCGFVDTEGYKKEMIEYFKK